jgi:dTDP-4-dehydrorhamnose 3,5-epimerase
VNYDASPKDCIEFIQKIHTDTRGTAIKPYNLNFLRLMGINHSFEEDLQVISHKGAIRGLYYQRPPYEQAMLVWCVKGSVYAAAVNLRRGSPDFGRVENFKIDSRKHNAVYIPFGFAHGYQALEEDTTICCKMSSEYSFEHEEGIRYDSLGITWPVDNPVLSEKDLGFQVFTAHLLQNSSVS